MQIKEKCISVCSRCGKEIEANYTHRSQKIYCTMCNKECVYIVVREVYTYE